MNDTTLVFDATNRWIALGIFGEGVERELNVDAPREASWRLVPEIQTLLKDTGVKRPSRIICTRGPGSFTGARICVGAGRNLAQLWDIPVLGIDSLLFYAYAVARRSNSADKKDLTKIAILMDGKQRRVYARLIDPNRGFVSYHERIAHLKDGEEMGREGLQDIAPLEFFQSLEPGVEIHADDPTAIQEYMERKDRGSAHVADELAKLPPISTMFVPGARELYELGLLLGAREATGDWRELLPIYLRRDPATAKFPRGLNKT